MKHSISAVIIAKNSEETIDDTLISIRNVVDEIIFVDTGSTDNTIEIAKKHNSNIYDFSWRDDFSAARNFGLDKATKDWILSIDSDEILETKSFELEFQNIPEKVGGILVNLINKLKNGLESQHQYTRIFRRDSEIFFNGRIHEQIRENIEKADFDIMESNINIYHRGYSDDNPEKAERNKRLLLMDLQENPNDAFLLYHLANTEFTLKNYADSAKLFTKALEDGSLSLRQNHISRIRLAQIALGINQLQIIEDLTDFETEDENLDGLRLFVLAAKFLMERNFTAAYEIYSSSKLYKSSMIDHEAAKKALNALKQILGK